MTADQSAAPVPDAIRRYRFLIPDATDPTMQTVRVVAEKEQER